MGKIKFVTAFWCLISLTNSGLALADSDYDLGIDIEVPCDCIPGESIPVARSLSEGCVGLYECRSLGKKEVCSLETIKNYTQSQQLGIEVGTYFLVARACSTGIHNHRQIER